MFSPIPPGPGARDDALVDTTSGTERGERAGWSAAVAVGLLLVAASLTLPQPDGDLAAGVGTRGVVAASGALLVLWATWRPRPHDRVRATTAGLGLSVLAYPVVLAVAAARYGGSVGQVAGSAWHVLPLTLVQLAPVLAAHRAVHRTGRRWVVTVVGVAVLGVVLTGAALAGGPWSAVLLPVSLVLWFGSFGLAPTACWLAVRGTSGTTRRRAVVAALAAVAPPLIIVWCASIGLLGSALGVGDAAGLTSLLLGFAAGTVLCGLLALAAVGAEDSLLLRPRTVTRLLDALLASLSLLAGCVTVVLVAESDLGAGVGVLVGIGVTALVGLPWSRLRRWTARVVDPASELEHELSRTGPADGRQRQVTLHVLRTLVGDPDLDLRYDERPGPGDVVLARDGGTALVVARSSTAGTRLEHLGDCTGLLRAALMEDRVARETLRADSSAAAERERLAHDLHDGLQGRLLGLALDLHLSGRTLEDPAARLLVEATVDSLRDVVEDVRALAGGRIPDLLTRGGLSAALPVLFHPVGPLVDLDLPPVRFSATAETTAYFVIGEAVANALKHAAAERIAVHVRDDGDRLAVTVHDDGCGGADPRLGSGLRGLSERVSAVGGVLVVRAGDPRGTVVEAVLPCAS